MRYVIGIDGGSTKCLMKAAAPDGRLLTERRDETTNHHTIGERMAAERIRQQLVALIESFGGHPADCAAVAVGAAGIDSPADTAILQGIYESFGFSCPIRCLNDGDIALYAATRGTGVLAIAGTGSIVVGRNEQGMYTRSGGYSTALFSNEGSGRWFSLWALNYASKWVDCSVPESPLTQMLNEHFCGLDRNKIVAASEAATRLEIDTRLAPLVYEAALRGDAAAQRILRNGAAALFEVAETCIQKLGYTPHSSFAAGIWGSVFLKNHIVREEYARLLALHYPNAKLVAPDCDAADGAVRLALDFLAAGKWAL